MSTPDEKKDPIERMVRNLSAEEMVDWLIKYKGMHEECRQNVTQNLREQFRWHRLQGRLDRSTTAALIAQMLLMRQSAKALETPKAKPE